MGRRKDTNDLQKHLLVLPGLDPRQIEANGKAAPSA